SHPGGQALPGAPASGMMASIRNRRFAMKIILATALALLAPAAMAQVITDCDWIGNPANIAEPWEINTRTFANGNIRVARLDTGGEPVCCASHLLILSPSGN